MPRYFFNIEDGPDVRDEEGTELPNPEGARSQAVITTEEILNDSDGEFWTAAEWRIHVTDEQGATVCTPTIEGATGGRWTVLQSSPNSHY